MLKSVRFAIKMLAIQANAIPDFDTNYLSIDPVLFVYSIIIFSPYRNAESMEKLWRNHGESMENRHGLA